MKIFDCKLLKTNKKSIVQIILHVQVIIFFVILSSMNPISRKSGVSLDIKYMRAQVTQLVTGLSAYGAMSLSLSELTVEHATKCRLKLHSFVRVRRLRILLSS